MLSALTIFPRHPQPKKHIFWSCVSVCMGHFQLYHTKSSGRCLDIMQQPLPSSSFPASEHQYHHPNRPIVFWNMMSSLDFSSDVSLRGLLSVDSDITRCFVVMLKVGNIVFLEAWSLKFRVNMQRWVAEMSFLNTWSFYLNKKTDKKWMI